MLITVNEEIVQTDDASLSPLDRGFLLGDGIFETLRIYSGEAFKLPEHLDRMRGAAARAGIELTSRIEPLVRSELVRAGKVGLLDGFLRITLSRGKGLGLGAEALGPTLVTMIDSLPVLKLDWYSSGIRTVTATARRNEFAATSGIKTTAYLESILAYRESMNAQADDSIFLDTSGHLSEATASNLFVVEEGTLHTPPTTCGALPGITRATVFQIAHAHNIPVIHDFSIEPGRLRTASEVFLTSSVREIVPVVSHDGNPISDGRPGPITKQIMTTYSEITRCRS